MAKATIKMLVGKEVITKAIASIKIRGKGLDRDIHAVAVSTVNHADLHGDITLANKLLEAMPPSARKNALRDWFITFGKFNYDAATKLLTYAKEKETDLETATNTPYWEFKPEQGYVPIEYMGVIKSALKRLTKAVEQGDTVPQDLIEMLTGYIAKDTAAKAIASTEQPTATSTISPTVTKGTKATVQAVDPLAALGLSEAA